MTYPAAMDSDYEAKLLAEGVPIDVFDADVADELDDAYSGCLLAGYVGNSWDRARFRVVVVDWTPQDRASFAEWAYIRIHRFLEFGPEPDGWQHRSDGDWQLWCANRYLGIDVTEL
jgi:hypothetical protein